MSTLIQPAKTARWCNGNTADFGSAIHGSSPCRVAAVSLNLVFIGFFESQGSVFSPLRHRFLILWNRPHPSSRCL